MKPKAVILKNLFCILKKDCTSNDGKNEISFSCLFIQIDFISLPWEQCSVKRFLNKKLLLEIHGSSLKKKTIEAIIIVKDSFLRYESILGIPVTKEMILMVSTSRQLYMDHLD